MPREGVVTRSGPGESRGAPTSPDQENAHQSTARSTRAEVRFDKFAIFDLSRVCGLTGPEQHLLLCVTLQADWRTAEWAGTFRELAYDAGMGRNHVAKHYTRLVEVGVFDEVLPFGRGREGRMFVVVYDELVVVNSRS